MQNILLTRKQLGIHWRRQLALRQWVLTATLISATLTADQARQHDEAAGLRLSERAGAKISYLHASKHVALCNIALNASLNSRHVYDMGTMGSIL